MVVDSATSERGVDELFQALADPTRRDVLRRVGGGQYSVSQLAKQYPMSFAAVQKHVAVLERAGLITKHRRGREQIVLAREEGLLRAQAVLADVESVWRGRVDRMTQLLAKEPPPKGPTS
ncbi:MAG: ArsR/SmtB family transcription factor [Actinomycetes bacterium]